jgi:hypothetical protein
LETILDQVSSKKLLSVDDIEYAVTERQIREKQRPLDQPVTEEERDVQMVDAPQERPRKRLRLSRGEEEDGELPVVEYFTRKVYDLLSPKQGYNLESLEKAMS